ncbi:MAG: hypothetical protein HRT66_06985 [Flavobacteriaceae bacterium]|nr:hypothetical protein [Flavobacteriaceae bacterium]
MCNVVTVYNCSVKGVIERSSSVGTLVAFLSYSGNLNDYNTKGSVTSHGDTSGYFIARGLIGSISSINNLGAYIVSV